MNIYAKLGVIVGLAVVIGAVVIFKQGGSSVCSCGGQQPAISQTPPVEITPSPAGDSAPAEVSMSVAAPRPKLVELGSVNCVPCKMMKPILDELTAVYKGKLDVEFIDVNQNPQEAGLYRIRVIPTQVFLSPDGKELFRHEGFFPKEDILAKWKELGYEF